jgi:peptide deformylase
MILTFRHEALRQKSEPVVLPDDDLQGLIDTLDEQVNGTSKIGLAANQIGVLKRVGVIKFSPQVWNGEADKNNNKRPVVITKGRAVEMTDSSSEKPEWPKVAHIEEEMKVVLINPEIITKNFSYDVREGCLSYPGVFATIKRYMTCTVKYMKFDGTYDEFEARGMLAQACQHEIDHMDGITFEDHFSSTQKFVSANKIKRVKGKVVK